MGLSLHIDCKECRHASEQHPPGSLCPSILQVFAAWRFQAPLEKRQRELLGVAAARLHHRALLSAWNAWRAAAAARKALRSRGVAVLLRMKHLRLASALAAWQEATVTAASKRQVRRAAERFAGSALRRAFETWRTSAAESTAEAAATRQRHRLLLLKVWGRTTHPLPRQQCGVTLR